MSMKVLEQLSGDGTLYEGDKEVGPVSYDLTVYQKMIGVRTMTSDGEVPGLKRIEGRIDGADCFDLMQRGAKVTLELEDGRRWNFYVTDTNGSLAHASTIAVPNPAHTHPAALAQLPCQSIQLRK